MNYLSYQIEFEFGKYRWWLLYKPPRHVQGNLELELTDALLLFYVRLLTSAGVPIAEAPWTIKPSYNRACSKLVHNQTYSKPSSKVTWTCPLGNDTALTVILSLNEISPLHMSVPPPARKIASLAYGSRRPLINLFRKRNVFCKMAPRLLLPMQQCLVCCLCDVKLCYLAYVYVRR